MKHSPQAGCTESNSFPSTVWCSSDEVRQLCSRSVMEIQSEIQEQEGDRRQVPYSSSSGNSSGRVGVLRSQLKGICKR